LRDIYQFLAISINTFIFKSPKFRHAMHFYIPGAIAGIIVFQVSIIAPTMFKKLKIEDFGTAIRSIWPKFSR